MNNRYSATQTASITRLRPARSANRAAPGCASASLRSAMPRRRALRSNAPPLCPGGIAMSQSASADVSLPQEETQHRVARRLGRNTQARATHVTTLVAVSEQRLVASRGARVAQVALNRAGLKDLPEREALRNASQLRPLPVIHVGPTAL
mmetsp:Transcript_4759/g.12805  ORF Transcript_4759/g.12805 Transcript_4759/m.12805 type:complete len:150 (-) Transcript_4759:281-730(-)